MAVLVTNTRSSGAVTDYIPVGMKHPKHPTLGVYFNASPLVYKTAHLTELGLIDASETAPASIVEWAKFEKKMPISNPFVKLRFTYKDGTAATDPIRTGYLWCDPSKVSTAIVNMVGNTIGAENRAIMTCDIAQ